MTQRAGVVYGLGNFSGGRCVVGTQIVDLVCQLHDLIVVHVECNFPLCRPVARLIRRNIHGRAHFGNVFQEPLVYQVVHALARLTSCSRQTCQLFGGVRNLCAQVKNVLRHFRISVRFDLSVRVRQTANVLRHIKHFAFKCNCFFCCIYQPSRNAAGYAHRYFCDIRRQFRCTVRHAAELSIRRLYSLRQRVVNVTADQNRKL